MGFFGALGGIVSNIGGGEDKGARMSEEGMREAFLRFAKADPALERVGELSELFVSPDDPEFIDIARQYEEARKRDLVAGITNLIRQNNRARARGSVGYGINPERRDEALSAAIGRGFADTGDQARRITLDAINRAVGGYTNQASGYTNLGNAFSGAGTRAAQIQGPYDAREENRKRALIEGMTSFADLGVSQLGGGTGLLSSFFGGPSGGGEG